MKFIRLPEFDVEISSRPVTCEEYRQNSHNTVSDLAWKANVSGSVTQVSASEAREFAARMGGRLPTIEEISALAARVENIPSAFSCSRQGCLSEWVGCSPDWASDKASLNCIVSPSWLQHQNGERSRGSIPNRRMSFVTFRLVRE